jgi:hypothetical protein
MHQVFRLEPNMPASAYTTYGVVSPKSTHTRVATCQEVECANHARGWQTQIDTSTELGQRQALYISTQCGRKFTTEQMGVMRIFTFHAGQKCFAEHHVSLDRPPLFTVKRGDWRINSTARVVGGQQWLDEFATNQENLSKKVG